jgi:predicted Rossmann fold nucleotide-binding protein DprA/Smf involved in DNA uptake
MTALDRDDAAPATARGRRAATPLSEILAAVRAGATSAPEVVRRTGLSPDAVATGLATLTSTGLVRPLSGPGCPASGCGRCPVASGCAPSGRN